MAEPPLNGVAIPKVKKRKVTPVSATPTHTLRVCVNSSFKHLLSPRGDSCEHTSPTVRPQTKPEVQFRPSLNTGFSLCRF